MEQATDLFYNSFRVRRGDRERGLFSSGSVLDVLELYFCQLAVV